MADRDTTSTPYKLSADAVCYFAYPNGDAPVVTVANYAELRTKSRADAGFADRVYVESPVHTAGLFTWRATTPLLGDLAVDDDGGVVISASDGGVWERKGALGGAIRLDWYDPTDGFSWDAIIPRLAAQPSLSTLVLHCPTQSSYGELDHIVISPEAGFSIFATSPYRFQQTAYADDDLDFSKLRMIEVSSMRVYLGANVELYGRAEKKLRGRTGQEHNGLLHVHTATLVSFKFYGKVTEPRGTGAITFQMEANSHANFEEVELGGLVTSGGVGGFGSFSHLFPLVTCVPGFEIADPDGGTLGIDPDDPNGALIYPRSAALDFSMANRYEGEYISRWGQSCTASIVGGKDGIGSAENPFKIYLINKGYTSTFALPSSPFEDQSGIGKFDGYDNTTPDGTLLAPCYIDYIFQGVGAKLGRGFVWEASGNSPAENKWIQGFHVRTFLEFPESEYSCWLDGFETFIGFDAADPGPHQKIRNNTIQGTFASLKFEDGPNEFNDIVLTGAGYISLAVINIHRNDEWFDEDFIGDIAFNNLTIRDTVFNVGVGRLFYAPIFYFGEANITITNLVFEGTPPPPGPSVNHPVIELGSTWSNVATRPVVLNLINPTLPPGVTVDATPGALNPVTFQINGVNQTLPWVSS